MIINGYSYAFKQLNNTTGITDQEGIFRTLDINKNGHIQLKEMEQSVEFLQSKSSKYDYKTYST